MSKGCHPYLDSIDLTQVGAETTIGHQIILGLLEFSIVLFMCKLSRETRGYNGDTCETDRLAVLDPLPALQLGESSLSV